MSDDDDDLKALHDKQLDAMIDELDPLETLREMHKSGLIKLPLDLADHKQIPIAMSLLLPRGDRYQYAVVTVDNGPPGATKGAVRTCGKDMTEDQLIRIGNAVTEILGVKADPRSGRLS